MATTQEVQILLKAVDQFTPTVEKIKKAIASIGGAFNDVKRSVSGVISLVDTLNASLAGIGGAITTPRSNAQGVIDGLAKSIETVTAKSESIATPATAEEKKRVGQGGDAVGHPFRGNQWAKVGESGEIVPKQPNKNAGAPQVVENQTVVQQKVDRKDETRADKTAPMAHADAAGAVSVPWQANVKSVLERLPKAPQTPEEGHDVATPKVHDVPGASGVHALTEGFGQLKEGVLSSNEALEKLSSLIKVLGSGFILLQGVHIFEEMAGEAAEVERLGTVVHMVGANAGYMASEIDAADKKVQSLGITASASRESLSEFIKSGLALEGAAKLARAAQDLAVISGENSSDTFRGLTQAISEQSVMMLRWRGISVSNEEAQEKFAAQQGRSVASLTEFEKKQALLNLTLERSAALSGIYEAAMGDVGKQATSLARYQEEAAESLQQAMMPAYSSIVTELTIFLRNLRTMTEEYNATTDGAKSFGDSVGGVASTIRKGLETLVSYRSELTSLAKAYIVFKATQTGIEFFKATKSSLSSGFGNLAVGKTWAGKTKEEQGQSKEQIAADEAKVKSTTAHAAASTNAEIAITGEASATARLAGAVNVTALAYERMAFARAAALKNPLSMVAGDVQSINKQALQTVPTSIPAQKIPTVTPQTPLATPTTVAGVSERAKIAPPQPVHTLAASFSAIGNTNNRLDYTHQNKAGNWTYAEGAYSGSPVARGTTTNLRPAPNALQALPALIPKKPTVTPTGAASEASKVLENTKGIGTVATTAAGAVGGLGRAFSVVGGLLRGIWSLLGGLPGIIISIVGGWLVFGGGVEKIGKAFEVIAHYAMNIKDTIHGWFVGGDKEKAEQLKNRMADRNKAYEKDHGEEAELKKPEAKEYAAAVKTKMEADENKIRLEYQQGKVVQQLKSSYNVGDKEKQVALEEEIRTAKEEAKSANENLERIEEEYKEKLTPHTKKLITSQADKEAYNKGIKYKDQQELTDLINTRKGTGQDQTIFSYGAPVSRSFTEGLKEARIEVEAFSKNLDGSDASLQRVAQAYEHFINSAKSVEEVIVAQKEWQDLIDSTSEKIAILNQLKGGATEAKSGAGKKEKVLFESEEASIKDEAKKSGLAPQEVIERRLKASESLKSGFTDFGETGTANKKREEEIGASATKAKAYYDELVKTGGISQEVAHSFDGNLEGQIGLARDHAAKLTKEFESVGASIQNLTKENMAFKVMELAIADLTKKTESFSKALEKVKGVTEAKWRMETLATSGYEFKGDKTSTVNADIAVAAAKDEYEHSLAIIQQNNLKKKQVIESERAVALTSAPDQAQATFDAEEKKHSEEQKKFREEHKDDIEYVPEGAAKKKKKETTFESVNRRAAYIRATGKPVPEETPKEDHTVLPVEEATKAGSGAEDALKNAEIKFQQYKDSKRKEGKGLELDLIEQTDKLAEYKKEAAKLSFNASSDEKAKAKAKVDAQEETVKKVKADLDTKRELAQGYAKGGNRTAEYTPNYEGIQKLTDEGGQSDLAKLNKHKAKIEEYKAKIESDKKYEEERVKRGGSVEEKLEKQKDGIETSRTDKTLAAGSATAEELIKVSEKYYATIRRQLDAYISAYTAKVEGLRDIHKNEIDLASTLAGHRQGDVIAHEQMQFSPQKAVIYSAEAEQGRIKMGAEGAKHEEALAALTKTEAKQKEVVAGGNATPKEKEAQLSQIEAEGISKRLSLNKDYFSQLNTLREDALAKAKQHAQSAVDFEKQARDTILEGNKTLREMNRSDMSSPDKYTDKKKEYAETISRAKDMEKAGDFTGASKQYQMAQGMASSLANSDAVDQQTAKKESMERYDEATKALANVQSTQGKIEKVGAESQLATVQNVTETMSKLAGSMHELATSAEIKLKPTLDEESIAKVQEELNGIVIDHAAGIDAVLNDKSIQALYNSVQSALDNHKFSIDIDEANVSGKGGSSGGNASGKEAKAEGGLIAKANGGIIQGAGTGTSDSIPALLSHGEFVVKREATDHYGKGFLDLLNSKALRFADGGVVEGKRKEGMAGWLLNQKYTADDVEKARTVKSSVALTQPHEDLLNRSLNSETSRRMAISQAAAYSDYCLGGLVSHFDDGGDVLLPGQVMHEGKPTWASQVPRELKKKEGFFGSLFSKLDSKDVKSAAAETPHVEPAHASGTVLGNKSELQKVANYAGGGDVLDPGQVMLNGKAVWASQVTKGSNKKEGLFSRLLSGITSKDTETTPTKKGDDSGFFGGLLGKSLESDGRRLARTVDIANYYLGGSVVSPVRLSGGSTPENIPEIQKKEDEEKKKKAANGIGTRSVTGSIGVLGRAPVKEEHHVNPQETLADIQGSNELTAYLSRASYHGTAPVTLETLLGGTPTSKTPTDYDVLEDIKSRNVLKEAEKERLRTIHKGQLDSSVLKPESTTTTADNTKTVNSNTGKPQEVAGHGVLGSPERKAELHNKVNAGRELTNADLAAEDKGAKGRPSKAKPYNEEVASDKWFGTLSNKHSFSEAQDIWSDYQAARIARGNHYDNYGSSHFTSSIGDKVSARDLGSMYAFGGQVVSPILAKYSGGGWGGEATRQDSASAIETQNENERVKKEARERISEEATRTAGIDYKRKTHIPLDASDLLPKSTTTTVSNAKVVNSNTGKPQESSAGSILGSASHAIDLREKIKSKVTLTNADLADESADAKKSVTKSKGKTYNEESASDKWFNTLTSKHSFKESQDIWSDYQTARLARSNHFDNYGSSHFTSSIGDRVSASDLGRMYAFGGEIIAPMLKGRAFSDGGDAEEKGIAQQTGEYWAHSNEEFEESHPNPARQLLRMLNPITGFGSALGTVHKAAGEGDLLGFGMGVLGTLPVLGSAIKSAKGAKLTADALKHVSEHILKDRTKEMVAENVKHQTHASLPVLGILEKVKSAGRELPNLRNVPSAKRNLAKTDASSLTDFISDTSILGNAYAKDDLKGRRYAQFADGGDVITRIMGAFGLDSGTEHLGDYLAGKGKKRVYGEATGGIRGATGGMAAPEGFINALVSNGEYRVNKDAVAHYGSGLLHAINDMSYSKFADGGLAGAASDMLSAENLSTTGQALTPTEMIELSVRIGESKASKVQGSRDSIYNLVHSLRDLQDRSMT